MNTSPFPAIPRLESLHHRLKTAKDADGEALPLLDELMVFLEDPPPGVGDRWEAGAELCAEQGVPTSRMAVWRFYRAHVLQWRREQVTDLAEVPDDETERLLDQGRHLVALRALESLHDPHLPPHVLVGLVQNENRRQEILLARDKFNDQLDTRRRGERRKELQRIEGEARMRALFPSPLTSMTDLADAFTKSTAAAKKARENSAPTASPIPPHNTP